MATWAMPMYTAASPGNLLPKFSGPAEGGTIARRASLLQATTGAADKSVDAAGKACDLAPRARAGEAATTPPSMPSSAPSATITPIRLMAIHPLRAAHGAPAGCHVLPELIGRQTRRQRRRASPAR